MGTVVSSNAIIGENCFIGAYAFILGNVEIGANSKIGAGTIVLHNVPAGSTVVNPVELKVLSPN